MLTTTSTFSPGRPWVRNRIDVRTAMPIADLDEARDRDLMRRIDAGEQDAFRTLFDRYAPTAHALARRVVRQAFLAEEIVQEVFLAVWRDPRTYDEARGSVRAWVLGMAHHRAVDAVRREEAHRRRAEEAEDRPEADLAQDPSDRVAEDVDRPKERAAVRAALAELPAGQREVVELMYFEGLSQTQVADRLRLPLGTVKSRSLLAMRRLRGSLIGVGTEP